MTNNDILRRLRYNFDFSDEQMIEIFAEADYIVNRSTVSNWLKKDDHREFKAISDEELAVFLNGFINVKRGKKEGPRRPPERKLNNNLILRKLKIALSLTDDDILVMLMLVDFKMSKHELSAFFRKPEQRQYRECKNQVLRNFLHGMQLTYRKDS